jgi:hypothetical protein
MTLETKYFGVISSTFANEQTSDGVLLGDIISQADNLLAVYNNRQQGLARFLGFVTTKPDADRVSQVKAKWGRFTEHGRPSMRTRAQYDIAVTTALQGYEAILQWTRFSQVLASPAATIRGFIAAIIEENANFRGMALLQQFFASANRSVVDDISNLGVTQTPFWNNDGSIPPPVGGKTFTNTHNHYLYTATSGTITSADLNAHVKHITEHGFRAMPIIAGNETTVDAMLSGATAGDIALIYERSRWIPGDAVNANQTGALMTVNAQMPDSGGLYKIIGVFKGKAAIAVYDELPDDYYQVFSHEGPASMLNPLQVRLSDVPGLQGIRPRNFPTEPLVNQTFEDFFGVGTRQRGNGVAVKWNNHSGAYADPTWTEDNF